MKSLEKIGVIAEKYNAVFLYNEKAADYTSFKIGGICDGVIKINSIGSLRETILACREAGIPYYILGRGSNVLISDRGYRGLVIIISDAFSEINSSGSNIYCSAGVSLSMVCRYARDNALSGLEFAYGIPGTIGGAVYMNAGAYGGQMSDVVLSCRFMDLNGGTYEIKNNELDFSYRHSYFTGGDKIIIGAGLCLKHGDKSEIDAQMKEILKKRTEKQPLEFPSAGSTFKRPQGDYASRLIEACGLKGVSCGNAEVSRKHAGFIINKGGATFEDVTGVIELVKEKVKKDTGVILECEVEILE